MSTYGISNYARNLRHLAVASAFTLLPSVSQASSMTAGVIMEKMSSEERFSFVAGIIEGLATSRYMADNKNTEGMKCIRDWFYGDGKATTVGDVYAAFQRYPDYPPGTVVDVMVRRACPG